MIGNPPKLLLCVNIQPRSITFTFASRGREGCDDTSNWFPDKTQSVFTRLFTGMTPDVAVVLAWRLFGEETRVNRE